MKLRTGITGMTRMLQAIEIHAEHALADLADPKKVEREIRSILTCAREGLRARADEKADEKRRALNSLPWTDRFAPERRET